MKKKRVISCSNCYWRKELSPKMTALSHQKALIFVFWLKASRRVAIWAIPKLKTWKPKNLRKPLNPWVSLSLVVLEQPRVEWQESLSSMLRTIVTAWWSKQNSKPNSQSGLSPLRGRVCWYENSKQKPKSSIQKILHYQTIAVWFQGELHPGPFSWDAVVPGRAPSGPHSWDAVVPPSSMWISIILEP